MTGVTASELRERNNFGVPGRRESSDTSAIRDVLATSTTRR
ncbi:hypothetical protein Rrhod_1926 [Rhodococcus rhodnii LMG 5362]|uniref:Uncharacterized protein n=1 Tax=Rhodococcus rhodnii LMG 5362 TaxID=1273125 RepID=R7WNC4_9NOCA|nr:hypothetical protein Rrhod_1926 [Rhodococcus rhodnii LMG 5362]